MQEILLKIKYPIYTNKQQFVALKSINVERKRNLIHFNLPFHLNIFIENAKLHKNKKQENSFIYEFKDIDSAKNFIETPSCFVKPYESEKINFIKNTEMNKNENSNERKVSYNKKE